MRSIRNISNQGLDIPFQTPGGVKRVFLTEGKSIEVPDSWTSKIANNLRGRKMVQIVNGRPDPVSNAAPPTKRNQTWFDKKK